MIIDGKKEAAILREEIKNEIANLKKKTVSALALGLKSYPKNESFWSQVRAWKEKKWEISMHGFTHVYDKDTYKNDYFNYVDIKEVTLPKMSEVKENTLKESISSI